jgi:hypothetical protein
MRMAASWEVFHRTTAVGVYEPELMTAYRLESWAATMDALRSVWTWACDLILASLSVS